MESLVFGESCRPVGKGGAIDRIGRGQRVLEGLARPRGKPRLDLCRGDTDKRLRTRIGIAVAQFFGGEDRKVDRAPGGRCIDATPGQGRAGSRSG